MTKRYAQMTIPTPARTTICHRSRLRSDVRLSATPSTMHHVTIDKGPTDPKGRGASMTTPRKRSHEILSEAGLSGPATMACFVSAVRLLRHRTQIIAPSHSKTEAPGLSVLVPYRSGYSYMLDFGFRRASPPHP